MEESKLISFEESIGRDKAEANAARILKQKYDSMKEQKEFEIPAEVQATSKVLQLVWLEEYARENTLEY